MTNTPRKYRKFPINLKPNKTFNKTKIKKMINKLSKIFFNMGNKNKGDFKKLWIFQ